MANGAAVRGNDRPEGADGLFETAGRGVGAVDYALIEPLLARHAADAAFAVDGDRRAAWISDSFRDLLGWDPNVLIGTCMFELLHPDDQALLATVREEAYAGRLPATWGQRLVARWATADGHYRWLSVRLTILDDESGVAGLVALRDVDDLVRRGRSEGELGRQSGTAEATDDHERRTGPRRRSEREGRVLRSTVTRGLRSLPDAQGVCDLVQVALGLSTAVVQVAIVGTDADDQRAVWGCSPTSGEAESSDDAILACEEILQTVDQAGVEHTFTGLMARAVRLTDLNQHGVWLVTAQLARASQDTHLRTLMNELHDVMALYVAVMAEGWRRSASESGDGLARLSGRQMRVLELMGDGLTNAQIASRIGFSMSTVRMESLAIFRTLGVHDRASAVALLVEGSPTVEPNG